VTSADNSLHSKTSLFEGRAFRIVFSEPPIGRFCTGKDLEVIFVADLLASVDINPNLLSLDHPMLFGELPSRLRCRLWPVRVHCLAHGNLSKHQWSTFFDGRYQHFNCEQPFGPFLLCFRERLDVLARIAKRHERATIRQGDWHVETERPRHAAINLKNSVNPINIGAGSVIAN
jgi:hypothetical protein